MKPWLFISDLHLSPERPEMIELFVRFCDDTAKQASRLYILGDFLEFWVGDDDPAEGLEAVFESLRELSASGVATYFMAGNRDFLVGERLAERCGFQILTDPCMLDYAGINTMLMHGDSLCTDDVGYQGFRKMVRSDEWQNDFLGKPVEERIAIAENLRARSAAETSSKEAEIMDVNQDSVESAMREAGVSLLIHGHTHRPRIHRFELDGTEVSRIVLTDWYQTGGYLALDGVSEPELRHYP